jgi:type III secretion protein J
MHLNRIAQLLLVALACCAMAACKAEHTLYTGLSQKDGNEMVSVLRRAKITAALTPEARGGTMSLSVLEANAGEAADLLGRAGLPRQKLATLQDVLPRDTWMVSPSEERARLGFAVAQELTTTLMRIAGVIDARVHVALGDRNALGQVTARPSASVLVRCNPDILFPEFVENIRKLVTNSVAGLEYDRVSVTMLPVEVPPAEPASSNRSSTPLMLDEARGDFTGNVIRFGAVFCAAGYLLIRRQRSRR